MKNLAGVATCDTDIFRELTAAGIPVAQRAEVAHSEVPLTLFGQLGPFTFYRAWYYWVVSGKVPLAVAWEMYKDPIGKKDVRVDGDCACRSPKVWAGKKKFIDGYHIDSQEGLNLFVSTINKYGLAATQPGAAAEGGTP